MKPPACLVQEPKAAAAAFDSKAGPCEKGRRPFLPEDLVRQCPYVASHYSLWKEDNLISFKNHVEKCRKNHPKSNLEVCRWYFFHQVPQEDFEGHLLNW